MLRRHLQTTYGMTSDEYRAKWRLPGDYPMVAPDYAAHRSALAKGIGLGTKRSELDPTKRLWSRRSQRGCVVKGRTREKQVHEAWTSYI